TKSSYRSLLTQLYRRIYTDHRRYLLPQIKFLLERSIIFSWGVMFALGLSAFIFPKVDSLAQERFPATIEEAALRVVVEKYFIAYGKKDLAGVVSLWSEKSPHLATYKQSLQQQFTNEDLSFGNPTISQVTLESQKAS